MEQMDVSIFDQMKNADGKSTMRNEEGQLALKVVKPITINTFIKRIFKIKSVNGRGSVGSDAENDVSQDYSHRRNSPEPDTREMSDEISESNFRWVKEECWPQQIWHECSEVDPYVLYNGMRRDGRRNINVPVPIDSKISAVDSYIWTNLNTQMHETQLPCILNNNFYKNKLYNYQNTTILKRLNEKKG